MLLCYLTQDEYKSHLVPRKVLEVVDVHDRGHSSFEIEQLGGRTYFCTCTSDSNQAKWMNAMKEALKEPDRIAQEEIEEAQRFLFKEENDQREAVEKATEAIEMAQRFTQSVVEIDLQTQEMKLLRAKVEETLQHTETLCRASIQNRSKNAFLTTAEPRNDRDASSLAPPTWTRENTIKRLEEEFDLLTSVITFLTQKRASLINKSQSQKESAAKSLTKAQNSRKSIEIHLQAWKSHQHEASEPDSTQSLKPDRVFTSSHLDAIAEGYLLCKHPTKRSQMQRRYYVLFGNTLSWFQTADTFFSLNSNRSSYRPLGLAHVEACEDWNGKLSSSKVVPHAFLIETTEGKTMYCSAPTRSIAEKWRNALHISITMPSMSPHRALAARASRSSFDLSIPLQNMATQRSPKRSESAVSTSQLAQSSTMEGYLLVHNELSGRMEKKFFFITSLKLFVYECHEEYESSQLGRILVLKTPLTIQNVFFLEDHGLHVKAFLERYANGFILELDTLKRIQCRAPNAREKENWVRVIQNSLPLSNTMQPLKEIEAENAIANEIPRQEENVTIPLDECEDVNGHRGELRWLTTEECEQWYFTVLSGKKLMRFDKDKTDLVIPLQTLDIERVSENESDDLSCLLFHVHYREAMNTNSNKLTLECRTLSDKQSWLRILHLCLDMEVDKSPDDTEIDQSPGLLDVAKVDQALSFSKSLQITELEELSDLPKGSDDIESDQSMCLLQISHNDQARGLLALQDGENEESSKQLKGSHDIAIGPGQILSEYTELEQAPGRSVVPYNSVGEEDSVHRIEAEHADITKHIEKDSDLFRSFLVRFYETYNPSKISSLDELIAHYSGKNGRRQLLQQLDAVYGTTVSSDPEVLSLIKEMSPTVGPTQPAILIEGYLLKRGHRIPSMRKRYFVLQSVNQTLRYFETKEDADSFHCGLKALGEFQIGNVCDWHGRTLTQTYKNGMQVEACDGRVYFCAASSEKEKESWIRAFHYAIASREVLCEAPESLFSPLRQKLFHFYERVNPSKLCDLDLLLHCYKGREPALLEAIDVHYGTSITGDPEWRRVLPDPSLCGDARLANALDTLSYEGQVLRASKSPATGALASSELNHLYEKTSSVFAVASGITLKLYASRAQWKDGSKATSVLTILSVKDIMEDNENDSLGRFAIESADHTWVLLRATDQEDKAVWVKVLHAAIDAVFGQSILAEEQQSRLDTLENIVWVESNATFEKKLLVLTGNKLCVGTDNEESILVVEGISAWEADFEDSKLPVKYPFQIGVQDGVKLRCLVENDVIRAHWIRTIRRNARKPEESLQISSLPPSSELDIATSQESMGPLLAWKRLEPDPLATMVYAVLKDNHLHLREAGAGDSQLFLEGFIAEMTAWEPLIPGEIKGGVQVDFHVKPDAEHPETVFLSFSSTQVRNHWYQAFPKLAISFAVETKANVLVEELKTPEVESSQRIPNCVLEGYLEIQSTRDSHWHHNLSHRKLWKKYYIVLETQTAQSSVHWLMYATQNAAIVSLTSASKRETDGPLQVYNVFEVSETESKEGFCFEVMYRMKENETDVVHCRTRDADDRIRWMEGIREAINMCESFCGRQKESAEIRSRLQSLEQDARRQSILIRESLQAALEAISDSDSSEDAKSVESPHNEDDEAFQNVCILDPETSLMHTPNRDNVPAPHPEKNVSFWSGWSHTLAEFVSKTFTCLPGSDQNDAMCHVFFPDTNCHFIADITGASDHSKCEKLYTCDYFSRDA